MYFLNLLCTHLQSLMCAVKANFVQASTQARACNIDPLLGYTKQVVSMIEEYDSVIYAEIVGVCKVRVVFDINHANWAIDAVEINKAFFDNRLSIVTEMNYIL
jgi:hypothetical protein